MPNAARMIYWDSCVFLHYIEGTTRWLPILDTLLDDASNTDDLIILTSTLSITEVAFAKTEKSNKLLDPGVEAAIDALWDDRSVIRLVEYDQIIAREARTLLRRSTMTGRSLKPADAIHLTTAQAMNVTDFHTTEDKLKHWNDLGFPVRDPWTAQPRLPL